MEGFSWRYRGEPPSLDSGPRVSVVVLLDDTTQENSRVYALGPADAAGCVAGWLQRGGWKSIRVEPRRRGQRHWQPGTYSEAAKPA